MCFQFLESLWPFKFWLHEFYYYFFFLRATVQNLRKFKKKGFLVVMSFISTRKISIWTSFWIWNFFLLRCWKRIGGCITMTFIIFCVFIIIFSTFPPNLFLELKYWKTTDNKYCFKTILREIDLTMQNKTNALQQHLKYHIQFILLTIKL